MLKIAFRWPGWINSSRWSCSSYWYKSIWPFLDIQMMTSSLRRLLLYLRVLSINPYFAICDHLWEEMRVSQKYFSGDRYTQRHNLAFTHQSANKARILLQFIPYSHPMSKCNDPNEIATSLAIRQIMTHLFSWKISWIYVMFSPVLHMEDQLNVWVLFTISSLLASFNK
jgi:hypothetical protein